MARPLEMPTWEKTTNKPNLAGMTLTTIRPGNNPPERIRVYAGGGKRVAVDDAGFEVIPVKFYPLTEEERIAGKRNAST